MLEGPIDMYHEWFRLAMNKWLDLAKLKAIARIKKAVELDEVRELFLEVCCLVGWVMGSVEAVILQTFGRPYRTDFSLFFQN